MSDRPTVPIRLVAIDLDGTLLRDDCTVGARSLQALRAANEKGIAVVLASGRMTPAMEVTARALDFDVSLISYNGAAVCGPISGGRERLFHRPLPAAVASELYAYARSRRLQVNYYLDDVIVSEDAPHLRPWIELYRGRTGSPYRFVESLEHYLHRDPTKLLLVLSPEIREEVVAHWKPKLGARASVVRTESEYLEFLAPGADKGEAVAFIARSLNVEPGAVLAMGNGENDVPMLNYAGCAVAVPSALPACRAAARFTTRNDYQNDAVAEALERWVL